MTGLELIRPGLLTTVQDLGRHGVARFCVSPSGAMDTLALRAANRVLGNVEGAPALEITGPGVALAVRGPLTLAIAGADLGATLGGRAVPALQPFVAASGEVLEFSRRVRGSRAVLAVSGGLVAPGPFASAATDLDAGLGMGRLGKGQLLESRSSVSPPRNVDAAARTALLCCYDDPFTLRFVPDDGGGVSADTQRAFCSAAFAVTDRSNRTGYRLQSRDGPLTTAQDVRRLSEPVAPGAIQLPPDGQPILLMADRQTIGGYPRLGHLIAADRSRAAQLWPGDVVRFAPTTIGQAHAAFRAQEAALVLL